MYSETDDEETNDKQFLLASSRQKLFASGLEELLQRAFVSINISPFHLFIIISCIQDICEAKKDLGDLGFVEEAYNMCIPLEEAMAPPQFVKEEIDNRWKELRIQYLN